MTIRRPDLEKPTPQTLKLDALLGEEPLLVGDLILCEVLQGARSEAHAKKLESALRKFDIVPMLDSDIALASAKNYRLLRAKGITVRKTIDLLIGTCCILRGYRLLHADRDFDPFEEHLGLRVISHPQKRARRSTPT
ncbi:MAG: PIN domain nuclease [Steroidobacteraceae bacterium]|nr:PIN domain nuclease [Steroidobacteraceae bacterium]